MPISSRTITVTGNSNGITLKDLREFVEETKGLPEDKNASVTAGRWSPYDSTPASISVSWNDKELVD